MDTETDAAEALSMSEALDWVQSRLRAGADVVDVHATKHPSGQGYKAVIQVQVTGGVPRPAVVDAAFLEACRNQKPIIPLEDLPDLLPDDET